MKKLIMLLVMVMFSGIAFAQGPRPPMQQQNAHIPPFLSTALFLGQKLRVVSSLFWFTCLQKYKIATDYSRKKINFALHKARKNKDDKNHSPSATARMLFLLPTERFSRQKHQKPFHSHHSRIGHYRFRCRQS